MKSNVVLFAKLIQMTLCPPLAELQIALVLIVIIRLLSEQRGNLYTHRKILMVFVHKFQVITLHCPQFDSLKSYSSAYVYKSPIFVIFID